jgi:hypothetical protein
VGHPGPACDGLSQTQIVRIGGVRALANNACERGGPVLPPHWGRLERCQRAVPLPRARTSGGNFATRLTNSRKSRAAVLARTDASCERTVDTATACRRAI